MQIRVMQRLLHALGYDPGPIDGIAGPMTHAALARFQAARGLPETGEIDARTQDALTGRRDPMQSDLPWMIVARSVFGLHEVRDNRRLRDFLSSDRGTLGDPAQAPWCGDFVHTCLRRALPDERFFGPVKQNPYWARNWLSFGTVCRPVYGAVLVFSRKGGGHVGFAVGQDRQCFHVLGGNQGDSVSVTRIDRARLLDGGVRWPLSFPSGQIDLPPMSPTTAKSVNEF